MSYPIKELHKSIELILKTSLIRSKQLNLIRLKFNHHNSSLKNYRIRMWLEYKYSSGLEVLRHILREWSCSLEITTSFQYASLDPTKVHGVFCLQDRTWARLSFGYRYYEGAFGGKKVLAIAKRISV